MDDFRGTDNNWNTSKYVGKQENFVFDDNDLRSSYGFGIKYYSPVGPIGFTWGFPIMDEEYDIKRMFLFSVGNLD